MQEQIRMGHLTFSYGKDEAFSLKEISVTIPAGQYMLIIGPSGCGKTTLLRHLKVDYLPEGIRSEQTAIYINGTAITDLSQRDKAGLVGYVRQNPESAQVMDKVWHELAFGLESLAYPQEQMQRKVAEMVAFFGLEGIYEEKLCNLSGGQKQLVNLAAVMVMEPEVLVLDEPTSQLDPVAATQFFGMVEKVHRELGTTIVMTEHRLEEVYGTCDRVLVMDEGRIICDDTPERTVAYLWEQGHPMMDALPSAARIYLRLTSEKGRQDMIGGHSVSGQADKVRMNACALQNSTVNESGAIPLTVNDGRSWLADLVPEPVKGKRHSADPAGDQFRRGKNAAFCADELWFRYDRKSKDVLKACSLCPEQGTITAILGGNGAGKSTLLHVLAGHLAPLKGRIRGQQGTVAMLPQNPQAMFAQDTVWDELCVSAGEKSFSIEEFGLQEVLAQHPFDLSGGQMQKLALAKLLLADYDILLLDEPGKGMDYRAKWEMGTRLQQLAASGKTIVMVSHDVEFCARYADCCGLFFDGHIVSMQDTRSFFLQNVFYTTSVCRMCRNLIEDAVTVEDVEKYFGITDTTVLKDGEADTASEDKEMRGMQDNVEEDSSKDGSIAAKKESGRYEEQQSCRKEQMHGQSEQESLARPDIEPLAETELPISKKSTFSWRRILPVLVLFLVMPATIYLGHTVLHQRKYYFISLVLVLEALGVFFLSYERKQPRLREMMVIAVMSAIAVAGRAAFYMVPNVKPMAAITILSGIGLGGEAGFLVGALSMLVSNIFFGQGPWTPWQMVAMGLLGFLGWLFFHNERSVSWKKTIAISVFGFAVVLIVYGGIMNPASVLMYQEQVNRAMILSAYAMGVPFDLLHACGTVIFLLIGTRPILKKLFRIQKGGN